jgi:hypothetical protein
MSQGSEVVNATPQNPLARPSKKNRDSTLRGQVNTVLKPRLGWLQTATFGKPGSLPRPLRVPPAEFYSRDVKSPSGRVNVA